MHHLLDESSFAAHTDALAPRDPLSFPGYRDALRRARERSGEDESLVYGEATIEGRSIEVAAFRFGFLGGSMGEVAGERLTLAMEHAARRRVPFVLHTETGGARMQEGMRSLIQMPKVTVARLALADAGVPYIAALGHPTTGGVLATVGATADVTLVESGATIGFAGPRLVERHTGSPLRPTSHTAASAFVNGLVDDIVDRQDCRSRIAEILAVLADDEPIGEAVTPEVRPTAVDPWEAMQAARAPERPLAPDLAEGISERHVRLRGDRSGGDDPALWAAIARVGGRRALILATDRHHHPGPPAYRKVRRCLRIAARLQLPVVSLIDTPGADPSETSEAGGIAWEIAGLFEDMLRLPVPTLSIVTGEGGSGGALALATTDRLVAFGHSLFSVIAPESAAEILWRQPARARDAARALRIAAGDLVELGIADGVVAEPLTVSSLKNAVSYHLHDLVAGSRGGDIATRRRDRWRHGRTTA